MTQNAELCGFTRASKRAPVNARGVLTTKCPARAATRAAKLRAAVTVIRRLAASRLHVLVLHQTNTKTLMTTERRHQLIDYSEDAHALDRHATRQLDEEGVSG